MLLIDSTIYNGEEVLELRLKYLYDNIDIFIIIESIYTFSGIKKQYFHFEKNINKFTNYLDKIIYIKINEFPNRNNETFDSLWYHKWYNNDDYIDNWFKENYTRNIIINYLKKNIKEKYILIVSDSDEIINKEIIKNLKDIYNILDIVLYIPLEHIYYNLNYLINEQWIKAFCINDNYINNDENNLNLNFIRTIDKITNYNILNIKGGWHLNTCLSLYNIKQKIINTPHQEINKNYSYKYIKDCINKGITFTNSIKLIKYDYTNIDPIILEYHNKIIKNQEHVFINKLNNNIFINLNLLLNEYKKINIEVLEIGCCEGEITLWLLNNILTKESKIICLDLFKDTEKYDNFLLNLENYNNKQIFLFITITNYLIKKAYLNKIYNIIILNNITQYTNKLLIISLCLELINKETGKIIIIEKLEEISDIINLLKFHEYVFFINNNNDKYDN